MNNADIAWAAGLFEGEGCIGIWWPPSKQERWGQPQIRLSVQMTDRDVVERFRCIVGCGKVSGERRFGREHHKPTYVWTIGNRIDVERILLSFRPWFGERRGAKADEALAEIVRSFRACDECGEMFRAHKSQRRFCSTSCQQRSYYVKYGHIRVSARSTA